MPKAYAAWNPLPHGPLERVTENLFRVEGTLERMPLRRVMTIVRRSDGALLVHGAIAVRDEVRREIEALGPVAWLVVPNGAHRLDAPAYAARYPALRVVAPSGARAKVEEVVRVAMTCEQMPDDPAVRYRPLAGLGAAEGALVVTSSDGVTLVLCDVLFHMPHLSGVAGFLLRHVTRSTGEPRVSRVARLLLVKDRRALAADLEALAATPGLRRVFVAHHLPIDVDAPGALRRAAATL